MEDIRSVRRLTFCPVVPGLPAGSVLENSPANAGDIGDSRSILGLRLFPGRGNGNSL